MHIPIITGFYAGLLGLLLVFLTTRVIMVRARLKVALLDGGHQELLIAIRRQGNLVELVPICLILIGILEMSAVSVYVIHVLGIALVVFRFIHPFGVEFEKGDSWQRVVGAGGTILVLIVAACWAIYQFVLRATL
jgi:uncharacterized membrane protein YecN with MAPEG domain